jgi:tRNA-splicing ligase RtcB (3'-phosphate/5'-hydroxy nucleic acid ligase)
MENTPLIMTADFFKSLGYEDGRALGKAIRIGKAHFITMERNEVAAMFTKVLQYPENFLDDELLAPVAQSLIEKRDQPIEKIIPLKEAGDPYAVYGKDYIEAGAVKQMEVAMQLPVTVAGALMPDAHQGYGLPIGGVLATRNAIIPYGVGVDIGCRMALSVFDIPESHFMENASKYKRELIAWTKFGAGAGWHGREKADHAVLENNSFKATDFLRNLHEKASSQLGTSGGGNHFVEWGIIEYSEDDAPSNMRKGKYLALLTHSGSRGFGATVAGHYTKIAKELCVLPTEAANLAYLDMSTAEGQEYWMAMNLAGDYASACHEVIHQRLTKAIGAEVLTRVENHHNFAWKEMWNGEEVIVHRKGATPAAKGVMGIIPGSMTAPGFLVRGKGEESSINSASHGAGRQMSRTQAIKSIRHDEMRKILSDCGVTLIGAGLDEAPMAYKDIHMVMEAQKDLVDVVATFTPKIVRMADDGSRED